MTFILLTLSLSLYPNATLRKIIQWTGIIGEQEGKGRSCTLKDMVTLDRPKDGDILGR